MQIDLIDRLEKLVINNREFDEIEEMFDRFCPFEALGVVGHEIRHSNFLAYCLDPNRPHGFGGECLKGVMRAVARAYREWPSVLDERAITPLDFHLMDFENARVRREWRGIDLLVSLPDHKMVVAFELKIDSKEHSDQLRRYRASIEEHFVRRDGWNQILVFLTKRGLEPEAEGWFSLELEEVAKELDRVVENQLGGELARNQLASYLAMLRRHHLPNNRLEELAARLWSQHREALTFLMEQSPGEAPGYLEDCSKHAPSWRRSSRPHPNLTWCSTRQRGPTFASPFPAGMPCPTCSLPKGGPHRKGCCSSNSRQAMIGMLSG